MMVNGSKGELLKSKTHPCEFVGGESWPIQCYAHNVKTGLMADVQKERELPPGWQYVLFARNAEE